MIAKLQSEKTSLQEDNQRLEQKVGYWSIYGAANDLGLRDLVLVRHLNLSITYYISPLLRCQSCRQYWKMNDNLVTGGLQFCKRNKC